MLQFLTLLIVIIAAAVFPLMLTARALGAERTGFWWVVLVLVLQSALSKAGDTLIGNDTVAFVLVFLVGALAIKLAFVTTYAKAMLISVVSTVITIVCWLLLIKLLGGKHNAAEEAAMLMGSPFSCLA
nr:hypothetical protein [Dyella sp. ASV24]